MLNLSQNPLVCVASSNAPTKGDISKTRAWFVQLLLNPVYLHWPFLSLNRYHRDPPSPAEKPLTARLTISIEQRCHSRGLRAFARDSSSAGTTWWEGADVPALGHGNVSLAAVVLCLVACQFSLFMGADDWDGVTFNSGGEVRNWNEFTWEAAARWPGANCHQQELRIQVNALRCPSMHITLDSSTATGGICSVEGVEKDAGSLIDCFALFHLSTFLNARLVRLKEGEKQTHHLPMSCRINQAERNQTWS